MRRTIDWKNKREDGTSYEVRVQFFGGEFKFQFKEKGEETWDYNRTPSAEDLQEFLGAVERRYQRRQATDKELKIARELVRMGMEAGT